ncbi:Vanillyl-alcohol oxidase [Fusarium sp. Ph1]|nr:Vanillyl-alcohol oxidase [Fusarium sp. Ph1]
MVTGQDATEQYEVTRKRCEEAGFDFIGTFIISMRDMHHIVYLVSNRLDPESCRRAQWAITTLIDDCIAGTYNFNNNAQMHLNSAIKEALDPKGILAPGKNGIWPESYDARAFAVPGAGSLGFPPKI